LTTNVYNKKIFVSSGIFRVLGLSNKDIWLESPGYPIGVVVDLDDNFSYDFLKDARVIRATIFSLKCDDITLTYLFEKVEVIAKHDTNK
jgi:hypothetical protein